MTFFEKISLAFQSGGIWMWFILGLQVLSFAIIVERFIALYIRRKADQTSLALRYEEQIKKGDIDSVYTSNQATDEPVGKAIAAGAKATMELGGRDEIQGKMDEVLMHENAKLEKRTSFLAMIGNVATLTGLLGTITGMIRAFASLAHASPQEKATMLSSGISEAMNTTAYGLVVAIPALVAYAVLMNRSNTLTEDLNQGSLKVFNWLSYNYNPVNVKSVPKG